jgi:uncharacterized membrane protein
MKWSLLALIVSALSCAGSPPAPSGRIELVLPPDWADTIRWWLSQPPCFSRLGDLAGGELISLASEISADGARISGEGFDGTEATQHGKGVGWTRSGSIWTIARISHVVAGSNDENPAYCVSGDGSMVGGYATDTADPGRPDYPYVGPGGSATKLGLPAAHRSEMVWGLSENGTLAVGHTQEYSVAGTEYYTAADPLRQATLWSESGGTWSFQALPWSGGESQTMSISRNGKFIVGFATTAASQLYKPNHDRGHEAVLWQESGGTFVPQVLPHLPGGGVSSQALDVSDNGTIVVGQSGLEIDYVPVKWGVSPGIATVTSLGLPPGFQRGAARAVSADGGSIVGGASQYDAQGEWVAGEAVIWSWWSGTIPLADLLAAQGVTSHADWTLLEATGIAVKDRIAWICGNAINPSGESEAFVCCLRLPPYQFQRPKPVTLPHWWNPEFPPPSPALSIPGFPPRRRE